MAAVTGITGIQAGRAKCFIQMLCRLPVKATPIASPGAGTTRVSPSPHTPCSRKYLTRHIHGNYLKCAFIHLPMLMILIPDYYGIKINLARIV
jgi:hypothetical protein